MKFIMILKITHFFSNFNYFVTSFIPNYNILIMFEHFFNKQFDLNIHWYWRFYKDPSTQNVLFWLKYFSQHVVQLKFLDMPSCCNLWSFLLIIPSFFLVVLNLNLFLLPLNLHVHTTTINMFFTYECFLKHVENQTS